MGGAQAIASLAYIQKVNKIVGPGNDYVARAKREVFGDVGIEGMIAGPSEITIVADKNTNLKEIITSILGIETRYGKILGNYRVIDSLTTLGFDYPRRSAFFKDELTKFFLLTRENNLDIYSVKGSYAGAMGYGQFISSSYRAYAIDFDGDNSVDLFNSVDDAIGSIANYLKVHGWKRNGKIVTESSLNNVREIYKPHDTLSKFISLSFNEDGKDNYFIGDDNFVAITKYNRSHFYAMAVYLSLIHI